MVGASSAAKLLWTAGLPLLLTVSLGAQEPDSKSRAGHLKGVPPGGVTLELRDVPLREALKAVSEQSGVVLIYASHAVPLDRRVSSHVRDATVHEALRAILLGTPVEVRDGPPGTMILVAREATGMSMRGLGSRLRATLGGRITDSATGSPLSGAIVTVDAGPRDGATSDDEGRYVVTGVPAGARTVTVRRLGYVPANRSVLVPESGDATLDVALVPVPSLLDRVVTTVTGAQRRLEVGSTIGMIDANAVVGEAPITSLGDLLNARVPGVQIVSNSGFTGSSPRLRIRGLNSLSVSNDPLIVVDGIRVENSAGRSVVGWGQAAGRMNDLNPEEIESIEVVKGPSAATLYGTDAANGVILIRTKRGRPGRAEWTAYAEAGLIEHATSLPANYHAWGHNTSTGAVQQCVLTAVAAGVCTQDSLTTFSPLEHPETSPIGTGGRQQLGLQVSGGVAQFTYFVSGEYEGEVGVLRMSDLERARLAEERSGAAIPDEQLRPNALQRLSARSNASVIIGPTARLGLSLGILSSESRITGESVYGNGMLGTGYRNANDGYFVGTRPGESFAIRNSEDVSRYITGLSADWQALPWLATRATVGLDFSSTFLDGLQRRGEGPFGVNRNGRRLNTRTNVGQYTVDAGASASFSPRPRLSSRTSGGVQYNRRLEEVTIASGTNLSVGSETVSGAAVVTGAEQSVESIVAGAYVEQTLGFNDRLFVTAALRADGGSSFGQDFETALYPKASLSWLARDLDAGVLNTLRLRAAYGASGVQPASTASLALITLAPALLDGTVTTGARLGALGNPGLKPERQTEGEIGIDVEALERRLRLELTYYDRLSRDALINRPLASEIGLASRQENIGSVSNRGVEGLLVATLLDDGRITWDLTLNGSINRNRLEKIGANIGFVGVNSVARSRQGHPLGSRFARPILGFSDADGDGIITADEVEVGDSLVYVGPAIPPRQVTAATSLALFGGRLRVTTQFDHRGGHRVVNFNEANRCLAFVAACRALNDPTTSLADQARAVVQQSAAHGQSLYGYLEDGSFVRWRELGITWRLPETIARTARARTGSITLTGRNLLLFSSYSGPDPEVNSSPGFIEGYSNGATPPQMRYWLVRVDLAF